MKVGRRSESVNEVPRARLRDDNIWMRNTHAADDVERRLQTTLELEELKRARAETVIEEIDEATDSIIDSQLEIEK